MIWRVFFTINDLFKLKKCLKYENELNFKERVKELKRRCIHICFNVFSGAHIYLSIMLFRILYMYQESYNLLTQFTMSSRESRVTLASVILSHSTSNTRSIALTRLACTRTHICISKS